MELAGRVETLPEEGGSNFLEVIHIVVIITNSDNVIAMNKSSNIRTLRVGMNQKKNGRMIVG